VTIGVPKRKGERGRWMKKRAADDAGAVRDGDARALRVTMVMNN